MLSPAHIAVNDISYLFNTDITVAVLRLDQLHPDIPGNKWFKLRYYLQEAIAGQKKNIITFGGAWSNHIIATAAACRMHGLQSTGIIRGEEPSQFSTTLLQAKEWGMQLVFLSRSDYSNKYIPPALLTPDSYIIPEGGYGGQGAEGAARIADHCPEGFTHYCCAVGTGTTMAGLINATTNLQKVIGISVMKNNTGLEKMTGALVKPGKDNWQLIHDYHFGGYARYSPELLTFMNDFYTRTGIPSDFVYTGKLFYAVTNLVQHNFFAAGSRLLLIHSGGLQGNNSLRKGMLIF